MQHEDSSWHTRCNRRARFTGFLQWKISQTQDRQNVAFSVALMKFKKRGKKQRAWNTPEVVLLPQTACRKLNGPFLAVYSLKICERNKKKRNKKKWVGAEDAKMHFTTRCTVLFAYKAAADDFDFALSVRENSATPTKKEPCGWALSGNQDHFKGVFGFLQSKYIRTCCGRKETTREWQMGWGVKMFVSGRRRHGFLIAAVKGT